ncbi:hypothetical protein HELRODRAFT_193969 [Helobdella robusta]|uniref:Uncharacterized protein n=1 Tax=Helobdella robusta TaxID=6412 RepID=T1FVI7_HELRO|nr:hypothetical protein HELRODRAFT_193969 [Helobdella robusta]ESN93793.1 hypothetical protein HELRODRAFT_193969 [Helobdella robusta]
MKCESNRSLRIVVSNASSEVVNSFLPILCHGDIFGRHQPISLVLFEFKPLLKLVESLKEDLLECCYPLLADVTLTQDMSKAFENVDVGILFELEQDVIGFKNNSVLFRTYGLVLNRVAPKNIKLLIVGQTANTSAFICSSFSPSLDPSNFTCLAHHLKLAAVSKFKFKAFRSEGNYSIQLQHVQQPQLQHQLQPADKEQEQHLQCDNPQLIGTCCSHCHLSPDHLINNNNSDDDVINNTNNDIIYANKINSKNIDEDNRNINIVKNNEYSKNIDSSGDVYDVNKDNSRFYLGQDVYVWGSCSCPIVTMTTNKNEVMDVLLSTETAVGRLVVAKAIAEHLKYWLTDFNNVEQIIMGVINSQNHYNVDSNLFFNFPVKKIKKDINYNKSSGNIIGSKNNNYLLTVENLTLNENIVESLLKCSQKMCKERDSAIVDCWRIVLPHSHL